MNDVTDNKKPASIGTAKIIYILYLVSIIIGITAIAGLIMAGILYYINLIFIEIRYYHLILFSMIGLAIYLIILFVLREFNKQDLEFFLDILHPKEMLKYISTELREKPNIPRK